MEKVDLTVTSTHGLGMIYRLLLGSVAAKKLRDVMSGLDHHSS